MANKEHLAILEQGLDAWNAWRTANRHFLPDLRGANLNGRHYVSGNFEGIDFRQTDLSKAKLRDADLYAADMRSANLRDADLSGACLGGANLTGADFTEAHLGTVDLSRAILDKTIFAAADLSDANFTGARIRTTDFRQAFFSSTIFGETDLSSAIGLATVNHDGPSTIGIDVIYASKGRIPEEFLRGCGVPENFIGYVPSLVNSVDGIQFYSCFISYSSQDEEFAQRLHGRMRDARLRVWFAPEDMKGGAKLHEQIETAIRVYDKLLIVLSEASLRSEWVKTELRNARKAERRSGKRKLFPVRLVDMSTLKTWECFDADSGKDLAVELREYFIPDFSHWKDHDQFESAFSRLLQDLRAKDGTA
jgi:TIR domain/Pentapeptide repeats (8 copies)